MLGLIAYTVIFGLTVAPLRTLTASSLVTLAIDTPRPPPPPPRQPPPRHVEGHKARQAASPKNLRNQATPIVAPILPPLVLPPVTAAPAPGVRAASNNGASDQIGNGQGTGGNGNGLGGGGDGEGDGDYTSPVLTGGDLRMSDLPRDLIEEGRRVRLEARYVVYPNGRTGECSINSSSGNASLDVDVCRLIVARFRYRPSRDGAGHPVRAIVERAFSWTIDRSAMERGGD